MTIVTNPSVEEAAKAIASFEEHAAMLKEGRCGSRQITKGVTWKWVNSFLSEENHFDLDTFWRIVSNGDRELTSALVHSEEYDVYFVMGAAVYFLSLPDNGGFRLHLVGPKKRVLLLNICPQMFEPKQGADFLNELKESLEHSLSGTGFSIVLHEKECDLGIFDAHWWTECDKMERLLDEAVSDCLEESDTVEYDFR